MLVKAAVLFTLTLPLAWPREAHEVSATPSNALSLLADIPELAWHVTAPSATVACVVTCWENWTGVHVAANGGAANERGLGPHPDPYPGTCAEKHPACPGGFAFTEDILQVVATHDVGTLRTMIKESRGALQLAVERHALQAAGCRGDIIGHLSIPASLVHALLSE